MGPKTKKQIEDHAGELEALKHKNAEQDLKLDQQGALLEEGSANSHSIIQTNVSTPYDVAHALEIRKDVGINCLNRNHFVATLENTFSNSNPVEIVRSILKKLGLGNDLNQDPISRFGIKCIKFFKN